MKFSAEISEELKSICPLLSGIEKRNIFSVPEGYFDTLTIDVLRRINIYSTNELSVPEGYFENLSTNILHKIKFLQNDPAQELRSLSPMLYSVQNENVFEVPAGYFQNLADDILTKVTGPQTKVIAIKRRDSIWKYAAAAVLTGVIGLSSLMMFNTSRQSAVSKANDLSVSTAIATASQFKNAQQINEGIASLSDEEIIKYLEKTGTDLDNETIATGIDENTLPAPKDYLLDDKTLDSYLNSEKNSKN